MARSIGFNRNIYLAWLDATAGLSVETDDPRELRRRLDPVIATVIPSATNRRKTIDILINIWIKTEQQAPELRHQAVELFQASTRRCDRVWLHFGLTLLYFPFFRDVCAVIGQTGRYGSSFSTTSIKPRLVAHYGQLGSLGKAVERVLFSLRDWKLLIESENRKCYQARMAELRTTNADIETWLLTCAAQAHRSEEIPLQDLVRLPELFPFQFTIGLDALRRSARLDIQRQGGGWDTVRVRVK